MAASLDTDTTRGGRGDERDIVGWLKIAHLIGDFTTVNVEFFHFK